MTQQAPAPREAVVRLYQARQEIHPREVTGRYATLRWACVWLTQLFFYGLPWLNMHGRQAVLFELTTRKFYLFGLVFWPQDFIYLAALLIICAYGLFLVTSVAGRVWCGYACPQTVYTEIFLWVERQFEGPRSSRIRLDRQKWNAEKLLRRGGKHVAWGLIAFWTGLTFVGYFVPMRELVAQALALSLSPLQGFWVVFYGFATYGNAGWMREQVCKYMCPYARFQSVMFDKDTLIVTYDTGRGEPRTARRADSGKAGDCIDCSMCVQVCPTGIDIRNGLQYECIGCAACLDACNTVMDKVARPRGLIRYATENGLRQHLAPRQILRRVLRPRVLVYSVVLLCLMGGMAASIALRQPLKVDVIRDRGALGREVEDGLVENVYRLQLMNTAEQPRTFEIKVSGIGSATVVEGARADVDAAATRAIPVRVRVAREDAASGTHKIAFTVSALDDAQVQVEEDATFIVPR